MTQTIQIYKVKIEAEKEFNCLLAGENTQNIYGYLQTLIGNGLFPEIKNVKNASLSDITASATEQEIQHAIHTSIEAIAWNPTQTLREQLPLLTSKMKLASTYIPNMGSTALTLVDGKPIVLVAEQGHADLLAGQLEKSEMWLRWTFAVNAAKQPTRAYMSIESYIHSLQMTVIAHDKLYEQNRSIITDSMYDALYAHLVELETAYPYMVHALSPTQRIVTSVVESLEKVRHSRPMLSLEKTTTDEGLLKFINQHPGEPIIVQNKEDGLTVVGDFNEGVQKDFVSRGDSEVGERLLHSCSQIDNIPKKIDFDKYLSLRFEVVVPFADFERINTDGKYSNTRNLASGTVRSLDGSLTKERGLKAYVIEIVEIEGMEFEFDHERIEFVRALGFEISDTMMFFGKNKDVEKETTRFLEYVNTYDSTIRPTLPHMIDGLVIKYDRLSLREDLGETSKYPKWALAYKFSSLDAITTLNDIVIQIGKSGQLSPVAEFSMVEIDGVEVRRATLHNFSLIEEKDILVGDTILVARANDVIPKVVKSFPEQRKGHEFKLEIPPFCPECGGKLVKIGEHIFCGNSEGCTPQIVGKLEHFVSRNAMNIDGCGEKTIAMLYEIGLVKSFADIYKLQVHRETITAIDKFGDKKFDKMIDGIEKSKSQPLNNVIYSLSIDLIGQTASKAIATVYSSMNELLEDAKQPGVLSAKLIDLPDFGEKMVEAFINYFSKEKHVALLKELASLGLEMKSNYQKPNMDSSIAGKTFVITGTLSRGRTELKKEIELHGGKVSGSVSKKTDYLLMGADSEGTSKHKDAIKNNVTIIDEVKFLELLNK